MSTHLEAHSVLKAPIVDAQVKPDVVSQPGPISSTMSERLFDGDLLEERSNDSNILTVKDEWVYGV